MTIYGLYHMSRAVYVVRACMHMCMCMFIDMYISTHRRVYERVYEHVCGLVFAHLIIIHI